MVAHTCNPATQEAEARESLELRRWRLQSAEIAPLRSSLGNNSETPSKKKEKEKHYHKELRQMHGTEIQMARMAKKAGNFFVPAEPKLAFVIRIRGIDGVSPKI